MLAFILQAQVTKKDSSSDSEDSSDEESEDDSDEEQPAKTPKKKVIGWLMHAIMHGILMHAVSKLNNKVVFDKHLYQWTTFLMWCGIKDINWNLIFCLEFASYDV